MGYFDFHPIRRNLRHARNHGRGNLGEGINVDSSRDLHYPVISSCSRTVYFFYYLEIPEAYIEYMVSAHLAMDETFGQG